MIWLVKFAMCAMMPRTDKLPGIEDTDLDAFLLRLQKDAEPLYWLGLVVGGIVYAITPLVTIGAPLPAFLLSPAQRQRHTDNLLSHPIYALRQAAYLVRLSAGMCWGADSTVRARFAMPPYPADPGTFRSS